MTQQGLKVKLRKEHVKVRSGAVCSTEHHNSYSFTTQQEVMSSDRKWRADGNGPWSSVLFCLSTIENEISEVIRDSERGFWWLACQR